MVVLPDWYVFIDVDPEEGLRRARARNSASKDAGKFDLFDNREVQFHHSVRRGYLEFFSKVPHIKIDANRPLEVVRRDFLKQMRKLLK
jgi:dTMP kinase